MRVSTFVLACALLTLALPVAAENVPQLLNYQGKLTDPDGVAVQDSVYSIRFRLWTAGSGGTSVWDSTQSVQVTNGVFNVLLGPVELTFDQQYYLELTVGSDPPLPRHRLSTSPYSFYALRARSVDANAITTSMIQDGAVGNADLGNNSVTSVKIADGQVGTSDLADGAVTHRKTKAALWAPGVNTTGTGGCSCNSNSLPAQPGIADICSCSIFLDDASCVIVTAQGVGVVSVTGSTIISLDLQSELWIDTELVGFSLTGEIVFGTGSFGKKRNLSVTRAKCLGAGTHTVSWKGFYRDEYYSNAAANVESPTLIVHAVGN